MLKFGKGAAPFAALATLCALTTAGPQTAQAGGTIAYEKSYGEFGSDIVLINGDGTNKKRLTNDGNSSSPALNPDGTLVAFTSYGDFYSQLNVMRADGTNKRTINEQFEYVYDPAFSPDGQKIVFVGQNYTQNGYETDIYEVDKDGSNLTQITNDDLFESGPAFSPDGGTIVFAGAKAESSDTEIYALSGQTRTLLTNNTVPDYDPVFSPDGSKIFFSSDYELASMNSDGSGQQILNSTTYYAFSPDFSPDGSQIAFSDDGSLATVDANGANLKVLSSPNEYVGAVSWARGRIPDPQYSMRGRVYQTVNGTKFGISGALVTRSGTGQTSAMTDLNGNYTFAGITAGKYQLSVAKDSLSFAPATKTVEITRGDVNYVNFQCFSLSGQAFQTRTDGTRKPLAGVQISLNGVVRATTDANGFYHIEGVAAGRYTITGRRAGYVFDVPEATIPSKDKVYSPNGKANLEGFLQPNAAGASGAKS